MNREWLAFTARLQSEARDVLKNNRHGVCVVTTHIAVDAEGNPLVWVVPRAIRVEPSGDAKDILLPLLART